MNLHKLILIGGVALTVAVVPGAMAQGHRGGGGGRGGGGHASGFAAASGGRSFHGPVSRGSAFRGGAVRSAAANRGGRNWNGHHGNGGHHWRHRGGGFYPYYAYDPYFGFGYGYPYWGTAGYYYEGAPERGESVAVEIQQELAQAGYYRGDIDGVIGNGTRGAIRAYERANGLPVDGRIDQDLLASMGLD